MVEEVPEFLHIPIEDKVLMRFFTQEEYDRVIRQRDHARIQATTIFWEADFGGYCGGSRPDPDDGWVPWVYDSAKRSAMRKLCDEWNGKIAPQDEVPADLVQTMVKRLTTQRDHARAWACRLASILRRGYGEHHPEPPTLAGEEDDGWAP